MNVAIRSLVVLIILLLSQPLQGLAEGSSYQSLIDKELTTGTQHSDAELLNAANTLYEKRVAPTLLDDRADMLDNKITDQMMNSATILGPIPVFSLPGTTPEMDVNSFIAGVHPTQTWAFVAVYQDRPLAVFHLGIRNGSYFLEEFAGSTRASQYLQSSGELDTKEMRHTILLRSLYDDFVLGDNDRIAFCNAPENTPAKAIPFPDFVKALAQQSKYAKEHPDEAGASSLAVFLYGEGTPETTLQKYRFLFLIPLAAGVTVGAIAVVALLKRKRLRAMDKQPLC